MEQTRNDVGYWPNRHYRAGDPARRYDKSTMFLSYLHRLPDLAILALIVLAVTGLAMLAPFIGRHIFRLAENDRRDEAAFEGFKAVMSMTGVVLAFSLVQVNTNLQSIEARVAKEGATLLTIDRAAHRPS